MHQLNPYWTADGLVMGRLTDVLILASGQLTKSGSRSTFLDNRSNRRVSLRAAQQNKNRSSHGAGQNRVRDDARGSSASPGVGRNQPKIDEHVEQRHCSLSCSANRLMTRRSENIG